MQYVTGVTMTDADADEFKTAVTSAIATETNVAIESVTFDTVRYGIRVLKY